MKAVVVPAVLVFLMNVSMLSLGSGAYTVVPAGAAGAGLYLDKVGPLLEGSENLPVVERLPRIARQPLWAVYEIGEPITGGCKLYDEDGKIVRTSSITVGLYRLTFVRQKVYYEPLYHERFRCDPVSRIYQFSVPTDGLEAAYYQIRLALPNGGNLDPEFRIQIGDAVFSNEGEPPAEGGCGG